MAVIAAVSFKSFPRNISKLERIQRRALKFILKTNDDYEQQRERRNLLSLEQRRFLFDILFLYKALNGYVNIDLSTYVQFFSDSDRYFFKMNVLLKRIVLELILLSLVFSIGS